MQTNYDRVTTILEPFSGIRFVDKDILDAANARGTAVHTIVDAWINGIDVPEPAEYAGYLKSARMYLQDKTFLASTGRLYDQENKITGEPDRIRKTEIGLSIVDFKTSKNKSKTWRLQGAAYRYLAQANGYDIRIVEFVRLSEDGKPAKVEVYDTSYADDWYDFSCCMKVYRMFFKTKNDGENPSATTAEGNHLNQEKS